MKIKRILLYIIVLCFSNYSVKSQSHKIGNNPLTEFQKNNNIELIYGNTNFSIDRFYKYGEHLFIYSSESQLIYVLHENLIFKKLKVEGLTKELFKIYKPGFYIPDQNKSEIYFGNISSFKLKKIDAKNKNFRISEISSKIFRSEYFFKKKKYLNDELFVSIYPPNFNDNSETRIFGKVFCNKKCIYTCKTEQNENEKYINDRFFSFDYKPLDVFITMPNFLLWDSYKGMALLFNKNYKIIDSLRCVKDMKEEKSNNSSCSSQALYNRTKILKDEANNNIYLLSIDFENEEKLLSVINLNASGFKNIKQTKCKFLFDEEVVQIYDNNVLFTKKFEDKKYIFSKQISY